MIDKAVLCEKIREIYPDIGQCGIDIDVDYDEQQDRWVVNLKKNRQDEHIELLRFQKKEISEAAVVWRKATPSCAWPAGSASG